MRARVLLPILFLLAAPALAADRHVLLDTDNDGTAEDCSNPVHAADGQDDGAAGFRGEADLQYCEGATNYDGKPICDTGAEGSCRVPGTATVTAAQCTGDTPTPGVVTNVTHGVEVDYDNDGTDEFIYLTSQACIYNAGVSDSCEVHAGIYNRVGAECDDNCGRWDAGLCAPDSCWTSAVAAFGFGPNLDNDAYGTSGTPFLWRGASMLGSVDTWDVDGDKDPSDSTYAAVISGDTDMDIVSGDIDPTTHDFEDTTCDGTSCSGDMHKALILGCTLDFNFLCNPSHEATKESPRIDDTGDGTIDNTMDEVVQRVDYFTVKDLEFWGFNGGTVGATGSGQRDLQGMFSLAGLATVEAPDGEFGTDGIVIDHVYIHDNDYSLFRVKKTHTAIFGDKVNHYCETPAEFKNSFIVQNNSYIWQTDTCNGCEDGCRQLIHDNLIIQDITSSRAGGYSDHIAYWKVIDVDLAGSPGGALQTEFIRFYNNEVIVKNRGKNNSTFADIALAGNGNGQGMGEVWVYGNIFRKHPTAFVDGWSKFWNGGGTIGGAENWDLYFFNNTVDLGISMAQLELLRGETGDLVVEGNNAYFDSTGVHQQENIPLSAYRRGSEYCTAPVSALGDCTIPASVGFTDWFVGPDDPAIHAGLTSYTTKVGGPLEGTGNCDPDMDGNPGIDYDGDGLDDTKWDDIYGNEVNCASGGDINVGADQAGAACSPAATCGNDLAECDEPCDGTDLNGMTCADVFPAGGGFGILSCNGGCTGFDTTGCVDLPTGGPCDLTPPFVCGPGHNKCNCSAACGAPLVAEGPDEGGAAANCFNGEDDDCDGLPDCSDPGCASAEVGTSGQPGYQSCGAGFLAGETAMVGAAFDSNIVDGVPLWFEATATVSTGDQYCRSKFLACRLVRVRGAFERCGTTLPVGTVVDAYCYNAE